MQETPRYNLWQIYTTINEWIRFADTKAGVALAAHGAVFTVAMPAIMKEKQYFSQHPFLTCNMVFCTLCAVVSVFYGIRCILPRLNVGEARSLIFFAHIAQAYDNSDSFAAHSRKHFRDADGYEVQVLDQIWANARVAWSKHKDSAFCLRALVVEMILAVGGFFAAFFFT